MARIKTAWAARRVRHMRLRQRLHGTPERPRLNVFRSSRHTYAQVIDAAIGAAGPMTAAQQERMLAGTARAFYRLS